MGKTEKTMFTKYAFGKRLRRMLMVDFRRAFTTPLVYIVVGACLVMPVLILVMTTMMDGSVSVDPQTGVETVIEGFDTTWQIIGTASGTPQSAAMGMTTMCNINLLYFCLAVPLCLFVSEDFRSGYAKNLFTVRAKKGDYVISKSLLGFVIGVLMVVAFFAGSMIGGVVSGLSFDTGGVSLPEIVLCLVAKVLLTSVFVPIYLLISLAAKQKTWLSMLGSLGVGALLFMMIPMLTPLDAGLFHVLLCLVGGVAFNVGLGMAGSRVLNTTALV